MLFLPFFLQFVFPCGEWFATSEGDGRLTRELARVVDGEPVLATRTYRLSTVTGMSCTYCVSLQYFILTIIILLMAREQERSWH